jgi:hypothetical protein
VSQPGKGPRVERNRVSEAGTRRCVFARDGHRKMAFNGEEMEFFGRVSPVSAEMAASPSISDDGHGKQSR